MPIPNGSPVWIVTRRGSSPLRCILTEPTPVGGWLLVDPPASIPDRFSLYTSFRNRRGRPCQVIWRKSGAVAFEFLPIATLREVGEGLARTAIPHDCCAMRPITAAKQGFFFVGALHALNRKRQRTRRRRTQ